MSFSWWPPLFTRAQPADANTALKAAALACGMLLTSTHAQGNAELLDVTHRPFEELLATEVVTAAKLAHQISGAASAVSIVTSKDIQAYGYRTLDDILSSMRGLHMAHASNYAFLAGRGYSDPGSYSGRITLLIDGISAAENYYGQSFFGHDGLLDVELIDRVEFIPGGGSSDYGGGAFLGVINIVTKTGRDFSGTQVAMDLASHNAQKRRLTWGKAFDNGAQWLLSASSYNAGERVFTDPLTGDRYNTGEESNQRLFIKGSFEGWTLSSAVVQRPLRFKSGADVGDQGLIHADTSGLFSLKYDADLSSKLKLSSRLDAGAYLYSYDFLSTKNIPISEHSTGRWWSVDAKLVSTALDRHTLVIGSEFRNDYKQAYQFETPADAPFSDDSSRKTISLFVYDDIVLSPKLQLNLGLRHTHRDDGANFTSPRAALIYTPWAGSTLKLSSGIAHMYPTAELETYGASNQAERVRTNELVWEQRLDQATRLTGSLYRYDIDHRIQYRAADDLTLATKGAEIEFERQWTGGSQLRASYAWQHARDQLNQPQVNAAPHNAKFNVTTPLLGEQLRLGVELQYLSARLGYDGTELPGHTLTNLALTGKNWWPHWQFSLTLRNAFNRHYDDVYRPDSFWTTFPRDGRNIWLQISRDFK